jgi:hypothetical protein
MEAFVRDALEFSGRRRNNIRCGGINGGATIMRSVVATLAVVAACLCTVPAQTEEDLHSGNYMLPYCEAFLHIKDRDSLQKEIDTGNASSAGGTGHFIEIGRCAGEVIGLADMLKMLQGTSRFRACVPREATPGQILRVVVNTLEQNPAELHENFIILAMAAMTQAWPCPQ